MTNAKFLGRMRQFRPVRVATGHKYTAGAATIGLVAFALVPLPGFTERAVIGWDVGALAMLVFFIALLIAASEADMERNAEAQEEGEWTVFAVVIASAVVSFAALTHILGSVKDLQDPLARKATIALVVLTLLLSWLVTHVVFALRYAHEYYQRTEVVAPDHDGGLDFPGEHAPDYSDFLYFSLVLGMTFQVSDVQITSRKLRRLATVHGLIGFLFNTVIIALTVNIASSLL